MTTIPSQLPTLARLVAEALDRLGRSADQLAAEATDAAEAAFFRRGAQAYRKALLYHLQGIAPVAAPLGGYLVPSATRGGLVHRVTPAGCSCEAAAKNQSCWHSALVVGIDAGLEALGLEDDGDGADGPRGGTNLEEAAHEVDTLGGAHGHSIPVLADGRRPSPGGALAGDPVAVAAGGARSAHPAERIARARRARLEVEELWS